MSPEEYSNLVEKIYQLVVFEVEHSVVKSDPPLQEYYPKLVVMFEFFVMLRDGTFRKRPSPLPEGVQDKYYKLEKYLGNRLTEAKGKMDFSDPQLLHNKQMTFEYHFEKTKK